MEYSKIIAITGLPGLFELVSSKSDGGIVRSLDDKSTRFVSSRVHQFSHLESIEVYTTRHNVNLVEVLNAMRNSQEKLPDDKDGSGLKSYFESVYPDLDFDRVYTSDLKKMVKWFSVLVKNEVEIKLSERAVEEEESADDADSETIEPEKKSSSPEIKTESKIKAEDKKPVKKAEVKASEEKPAKKSEAKAPEEKPAKKTVAKAPEEKPVKKGAPKKEAGEEKPAGKASPKAVKEEKKPAAKAPTKKPAAKKK